jgi:hypothetical protein
MSAPSGRRTIVWGHLALLAVIVAVIIAYILDARSVSLRTNNLLLIQPAAFIALLLAALVAPQLVQQADPANEDETARRARIAELIKVGCLAAAFGVFVFSLETIGFDVGTFVFTAVGLRICGERRIWVMLLYSAFFTAALIYGYQQLVTYPFPLSVL